MTSEPAPSEVFKERLRAARELRKLSQPELAKLVGMPPSSISHFEGGGRKPSFDNLQRLATALEVTTDYLLGRVDEPGMALSADPLFRDLSKLTASDREQARDYLKWLADRKKQKPK